MVIVLVPTGTPSSADRQLEAERGHFGQANHSRTANDSTAGISIDASLATNGTAPVAALDELVHAGAGAVALAVTGVDGETAGCSSRHGTAADRCSPMLDLN
jgi:hypothetical protein